MDFFLYSPFGTELVTCTIIHSWKKAIDLQAQMGPVKSEWINTIQFLLSTLNLGNNFMPNPTLMGTPAFSTLCRNKVRDLFIKQWNAHISGSDLALGQTNKMRFYKVFKWRFEKEPYLDYVPNFNRRSILTKFRCSNHSLAIEKGRHRNIPLENRICPVCKSNVETETHFLQDCFLYKDLRTKYFGDNLSNNDWLNILQCKDRSTSSKLINFLEKAFKLRDRYKAIWIPCQRFRAYFIFLWLFCFLFTIFYIFYIVESMWWGTWQNCH